MFLIDTNIWLELLLGQEKALQTNEMLQKIPLHNLVISDFALHSIGVILDRHKKHKEFNDFIEDIIIKGKTKLVTLSALQLQKVANLLETSGFDFDDAYQVITMQEYNLQLVSFDSDFAKQKIDSYTPQEAILHYITIINQ